MSTRRRAFVELVAGDPLRDGALAVAPEESAGIDPSMFTSTSPVRSTKRPLDEERVPCAIFSTHRPRIKNRGLSYYVFATVGDEEDLEFLRQLH